MEPVKFVGAPLGADGSGDCGCGCTCDDKCECSCSGTAAESAKCTYIVTADGTAVTNGTVTSQPDVFKNN
jgi:hypothetical protein